MVTRDSRGGRGFLSTALSAVGSLGRIRIWYLHWSGAVKNLPQQKEQAAEGAEGKTFYLINEIDVLYSMQNRAHKVTKIYVIKKNNFSRGLKRMLDSQEPGLCAVVK